MPVPGVKFLGLFCSSLFLNVFFFSYHFLSTPPLPWRSWGGLTWTRRAAEEAEAVAAIACSGHGRAYIDGIIAHGRPVCECNACYAGADCSSLKPNCAADADRWVLIKDEKVYKKAMKYMDVNTMGVSRDTQLRVLKLIKVILAEMGGGGGIFEFRHKALKNRWRKLNEVVSWSNRFSLQQIDPQYCTYFQKMRDPSPAYAWIKCEFEEEDEDCAKVLEEAGIISRGGTIFEASSRYTRLSLIKTQDDFDLLLQKMVALVSEEGVSSI